MRAVVAVILAVSVVAAQAYNVTYIPTPSITGVDVDSDGNPDVIKIVETVQLTDLGQYSEIFNTREGVTVLATELYVAYGRPGEDPLEMPLGPVPTDPAGLTYLETEEGNYIGYNAWGEGSVRRWFWHKTEDGVHWTPSDAPMNHCPGVMWNGMCVSSEPDPAETFPDSEPVSGLGSPATAIEWVGLSLGPKIVELVEGPQKNRLWATYLPTMIPTCGSDFSPQTEWKRCGESGTAFIEPPGYSEWYQVRICDPGGMCTMANDGQWADGWVWF